jgi:AraC-like DNA-binding protein
MRDNARVKACPTMPEGLPPVIGDVFNPAFFKSLEAHYREKTGYSLVLSDPNGTIQMGLPDCDKFPCMKSCRQCREQIVSEALRTGKVCMDTCHEGYAIWGLPVWHADSVIGGLIVIGGEHRDSHDPERFGEACASLYQLMDGYDLLAPGDHFREVDRSSIQRYVHRKAFDSLQEALETHRKPLLDGLKMAEFKSTEAHLFAIRKAFKSASSLPIDVLRGNMGDLVYEAKRQFLGAGMDAYACSAEAGDSIDRIARAEDADALSLALAGFYEKFLSLARQQPKDPDDLLIERATTYMEEHLRENLTRESVARAVGISPSHFSRLIRDKKGRTFTDLLNQYRIERASSLLVRSSHTLAHIANEAGFCDQSYFSKVFRRYKDMSPARYRAARKA